MSEGLNVPAQGAFDFLALGALVHRLDPGIIPFRKAAQCTIHVSGGEFNCAANLADCFKMRTAIATAMVDYPIGDLIDERVRAMGVTPFYRRFAHDGVRGPNMATVYGDRGYGIRPPVVFYNRSNEAAALLKPGDFDWAAIFAQGVRWFHSGGIFASLADTTPDLIIEAMQAAKSQGAIVSFDVNYRDKLWNGPEGRRDSSSVMKRILQHVDVLLASEEDLQHGLGVPGPDVRVASTLAPDVFFGMMNCVVGQHPQIKVIATTMREVVSANRHRWSAAVWIEGRRYVAPVHKLDVYDRVGGGDGFASGFLYGLLRGETPEDSVKLGWAHGALLTTFPGDTTMATLDEVRALARGRTARIQR